MEIKSKLLNNTCIKEITREVKIYFELKATENTTFQKLWDAARASLRMEFTYINAYISKEKGD